MVTRTASPTIFIQEELSDARVRVEELKQYIVRVLDMIEESDKKDHFYAVAGDIIQAVPECVLKIERALGAAAMTIDKVDFEEQRQILRPEKVEELEKMLDEIRIRLPRRV